MWFVPRSGVGLNDLLGRSWLTPSAALAQPLGRTLPQIWAGRDASPQPPSEAHQEVAEPAEHVWGEAREGKGQGGEPNDGSAQVGQRDCSVRDWSDLAIDEQQKEAHERHGEQKRRERSGRPPAKREIRVDALTSPGS
jgi:hypothetical protein